MTIEAVRYRADRARPAPRDRAAVIGLTIEGCFDRPPARSLYRRLRSIHKGGFDEEDLCHSGDSVRAFAVVLAVAAATPYNSDTLVTVDSPTSPFSQNKQNEPAVAVNPWVPCRSRAAGVNDEIDMEACNNRDRPDVSVHAGRGRLRRLLLRRQRLDVEPARGTRVGRPVSVSAWSGRNRVPADNCDPKEGAIGTLPRYYENGLVADGDPAVGFGPQCRRKPDADRGSGRRRHFVFHDHGRTPRRGSGRSEA